MENSSNLVQYWVPWKSWNPSQTSRTVYKVIFTTTANIHNGFYVAHKSKFDNFPLFFFFLSIPKQHQACVQEKLKSTLRLVHNIKPTQLFDDCYHIHIFFCERSEKCSNIGLTMEHTRNGWRWRRKKRKKIWKIVSDKCKQKRRQNVHVLDILDLIWKAFSFW